MVVSLTIGVKKGVKVRPSWATLPTRDESESMGDRPRSFRVTTSDLTMARLLEASPGPAVGQPLRPLHEARAS